jgi:hypothetical protein
LEGCVKFSLERGDRPRVRVTGSVAVCKRVGLCKKMRRGRSRRSWRRRHSRCRRTGWHCGIHGRRRVYLDCGRWVARHAHVERLAGAHARRNGDVVSVAIHLETVNT